MMPAPTDHGLQGNVRLDHITAAHVDRTHTNVNRPGVYGKVISGQSLKHVEDARSLVKAHHDTAYHRSTAGEAHRHHQNIHTQVALRLWTQGHFGASAHHVGQAAMHAGLANRHQNAADSHWEAAKAVNGPNEHALHHAEQSAQLAYGVHHSLGAAIHHDQLAHNFRQQGNHDLAQYHNELANAGRHAAQVVSTKSFHAHNAATGRHP
jgi:hypothetical protein